VRKRHLARGKRLGPPLRDIARLLTSDVPARILKNLLHPGDSAREPAERYGPVGTERFEQFPFTNDRAERFRDTHAGVIAPLIILEMTNLACHCCPLFFNRSFVASFVEQKWWKRGNVNDFRVA
jgi:hypothetical protein